MQEIPKDRIVTVDEATKWARNGGLTDDELENAETFIMAHFSKRLQEEIELQAFTQDAEFTILLNYEDISRTMKKAPGFDAKNSPSVKLIESLIQKMQASFTDAGWYVSYTTSQYAKISSDNDAEPA